MTVNQAPKTAEVPSSPEGQALGLADFLQLASEREGVPDDDARLDFADGGIGKYATGMPVYNPTIDRLQEGLKMSSSLRSAPRHMCTAAGPAR